MHPIVRLVNRNLTISLNKTYLMWQIIFPIIYIFVAGFAYSALIDSVPFGIGKNESLDYTAYLASGMIGFNIMNSTLVSGIIIWNDRRYGMFEQILAGPFTRSNYVLANVYTIGIVGLISASLIIVVGSPVFFNAVQFNVFTLPLIVFASLAGSVLFGSIAIIISSRMRSSEIFNVVINTVFLFFAFASTAFYPIKDLPEVLRITFLVNPLTYVVDIVRAGIFASFNSFLIVEAVILSAVSLACFVMATRILTKISI